MLDLPDDKKQFILENLAQGHSPTVISRAYQRRYGVVLRPQDIQNFKVVAAKAAPKRRDVEEIKSKLGSHDQQLEWARAKLRQRMEDEDITNNDLVNLARELRSNITASQQIASMNDEKGSVTFQLIYGDTVIQEDTQDVDFKVLDND